MLVGVHNQTWNVNELDDYSYLQNAVFQDDPNILLTQGDQPIWGTPPGKTLHNTVQVFNVVYNPIIRYQKGHFSSDPAVELLPDYKEQPTDDGRPLLCLLTSTDLCDVPNNEWPMNGTRLYWTYGNNQLQTIWKEYDTFPLFQEKDFAFISHAKANNHMFAPDLQYVDETNRLNFYIPIEKDTNNNTIFRIAVASAPITGGTCPIGPTTIENNFFAITNVNGSPYTGTSFDPGIFHAKDILHDANGNPVTYDGYFMTFAAEGLNSEHNDHSTIDMMQVNQDLKSGTDFGKVIFTNGGNYTKQLARYKEGPDVHILHSPIWHQKHYYLVFAAQVLPGQQDPGYIGYAWTTPEKFWEAKKNGSQLNSSAANCWEFKGWIFQDIKSGRSNQVALTEMDGHYYAFYHRVSPEFSSNVATSVSRSRQVCVKEIELFDDPNDPTNPHNGEILGVTLPSSQTDYSSFASYDGLSKTTAKNFIVSKDISYNYPTNPSNPDNITRNNTQATVRLSSLKNTTGSALSQFTLHYYLNLKPDLGVTVNKDIFTNFSTINLKRVAGRIWDIALDYSGPTLPDGETLPTGDQFVIKAATGSFDKDHDTNLPLGWYDAWSTRVAITDPSSGNLLAGEACPNIESPVLIQTNVPDANNLYTYLMIMSKNPDDGVQSYYPDISLGQQWVFEDASEFRELPDADKPFAFRIKNVLTGLYLTCQNIKKTASDGSTCFWILDQALRPSWNTQVWIREPNLHGTFRLRSAFKNKDNDPNHPLDLYLKRYNGSSTGTQQVFAVPGSTTNPQPLEIWLTSSAPVAQYIRTKVPDNSGAHTYATMTYTDLSVNPIGINSQPLKAGWTSQERVLERATDYPTVNAFRIRNAATNYYMTCNDKNKGSGSDPYFYCYSQALNKSWNTQVWIKQDNSDGSFTLKSVYQDIGEFPNNPLTIYLTRDALDPNANPGIYRIYVRPTNSQNSNNQLWVVE